MRLTSGCSCLIVLVVSMTQGTQNIPATITVVYMQVSCYPPIYNMTKYILCSLRLCFLKGTVFPFFVTCPRCVIHRQSDARTASFLPQCPFYLFTSHLNQQFSKPLSTHLNELLKMQLFLIRLQNSFIPKASNVFFSLCLFNELFIWTLSVYFDYDCSMLTKA